MVINKSTTDFSTFFSQLKLQAIKNSDLTAQQAAYLDEEEFNSYYQSGMDVDEAIIEYTGGSGALAD